MANSGNDRIKLAIVIIDFYLFIPYLNECPFHFCFIIITYSSEEIHFAGIEFLTRVIIPLLDC